MFVADPRITHLTATREQVVFLASSLNRPHVVVPGKAAQAIQAYLVGLSAGHGVFCVYVFLHLLRTREAVVYMDRDRPEVGPGQLAEAQAEALAFLESMGFLIEPAGFRNLPAQRQEELVRSLPCFSKNLPAAETAPAADAARHSDPPQLCLARLLAAI